MKITLKRIITVILCTVIAIAGAGTNTAYAAEKPSLKVTFNGKSINLIKVLENGNEEAATAETVVKKWGKPTKKKKLNDIYTEYVWKKGKTSIQFSNCKNSEDEDAFLCHFSVRLTGKNDALCGIKIGTKKETALKKLKKMFGKNNICVTKEGQVISFKNGKLVPEGKPTGDGETISVSAYSYVMLLYFDLKDGKISSMGFSS